MISLRQVLQALRPMARPSRGRTLLSVLIGLVRIAASLGFVWICKRLVDIATGVSDAPLGLNIGILLGIMLLQLVCSVSAAAWESYNIARTGNDLRADTFSSVLRSSWNGRERFRSGDAVNRLEEDVRVVTDLLCTRFPDTLITLVQLIAASVFLMTLASRLLWVLLILMVAAVVGSRMFFRTLRKLTERIRSQEGEVQQLMQENLQKRIVVLTLVGTKRVMQRLGWLQEDIVGNTVLRLRYNAVARAFMHLGFMGGYAAAFLWGVIGIRDGVVTYGMMTAFLQLVGQVQRPIAEIARQIPAFIHATTSVERLLDLQTLEQEPEEEERRITGAPGVRLTDVRFAFPERPDAVLEGFSYDFAPGTMTVVMGPTGVGKSTLSRLVLGLLHPDKGNIEVYGPEGAFPAGPGVRCNFQYVPQGNSLLSGTIRENLLLADADADETQLREALHTAVADFVFELPQGLDTPCGEEGTGLSEGQCQRIAIARALLRKGGFLILDEATSALDAATEGLLLDRIFSRCRGGKTLLFISHREAVTARADQILRFD
ncbi:MAG: ABC transporter ATP-binding protein/permease [Bacteroidales bacterium]|nr:ABC transporter ATP-binding protein/permease [Bacteroidales bacterium]